MVIVIRFIRLLWESLGYKIIHQVRTEKIPTVNDVYTTSLISIDFDFDFISSFTPWFLFWLRGYIKPWRQWFIGDPENTTSFVEHIPLLLGVWMIWWMLEACFEMTRPHARLKNETIRKNKHKRLRIPTRLNLRIASRSRGSKQWTVKVDPWSNSWPDQVI